MERILLFFCYFIIDVSVGLAPADRSIFSWKVRYVIPDYSGVEDKTFRQTISGFPINEQKKIASVLLYARYFFTIIFPFYLSFRPE